MRHEKETRKLEPEEIDVAKVRQILAQMHSMAEVDPRLAEKILDDLYNEHGLPK